jgi:hypothetical protein
MNIVANFEYRASSSRGKHEGESSFALCDRLSRTRDNSQRQLPTDHDCAVPTREYQTDQSSLKTARLLLALSSRKRKDNYKNIPTDFAVLTWSLHIRAIALITVIMQDIGALPYLDPVRQDAEGTTLRRHD